MLLLIQQEEQENNPVDVADDVASYASAEDAEVACDPVDHPVEYIHTTITCPILGTRTGI